MALTPINGKVKKRNFITFDFEWIPGDPEKAAAHGFKPLEFRLAGVYDRVKGYRAYLSLDEFIRGEFRYGNRHKWFMAHNAGRSDFIFLLEPLARLGYEIEALFAGSAAILFKIKKGRHCWTLIDSLYLIKTSLREIGELIGSEKGGEEDNTDIFYGSTNDLLEYNRIDCEVLYKGIELLQETILSLGGEMQVTIASTAMNLFRRKYLKREIETSPAINDFSEGAYCASRVEPFNKKLSRGKYYDINSSFPYAMQSPLPGNLKGIGTTRLENELQIIRCKVHVPDMYVPPIPYRKIEKGIKRIYYPVGTWEGCYTTEHINTLEEFGGNILEIKECYTFEKTYDLGEYAAEIYNNRMKSQDPAWRQFNKYLLNCPYGKFAEGETKSVVHYNPSEEFFNTKDSISEIAPGIWSRKYVKNIPWRHIPYSAFITSIASCNLSRYLRAAGRPYYTDTDGFAVDSGVEFPTSNKLGDLKLEAEIKKGYFERPKLYYFEKADGSKRIKAKGFTKIWDGKDNRKIKYSDFVDILNHKEIPFAHFFKMKELLNAGELLPKEAIRTKQNKGEMREKRCFAKYDSRPWNVDELL